MSKRKNGNGESHQLDIDAELAREMAEGQHPAFRRGSKWTSRAAAGSMVPHMGEQHLRILEAIRLQRGLTNLQISQSLGIWTNSVNGRVRELELRGLIRDSGHTRLNTTGRRAVIWVAADQVDPPPPAEREAL